MLIRAFRLADEAAVIALWEACDLIRPWNDPHKDIARKLGVQPEMFLVGELDNELMASVMAGFDGHRGWINYLAVAPVYQRRSLGQQLIAEVERMLLACGCPKLNIQVRTSNAAVLGFYGRLGYAQDDVICLSKRLIAD